VINNCFKPNFKFTSLDISDRLYFEIDEIFDIYDKY